MQLAIVQIRKESDITHRLGDDFQSPAIGLPREREAAMIIFAEHHSPLIFLVDTRVKPSQTLAVSRYAYGVATQAGLGPFVKLSSILVSLQFSTHLVGDRNGGRCRFRCRGPCRLRLWSSCCCRRGSRLFTLHECRRFRVLKLTIDRDGYRVRTIEVTRSREESVRSPIRYDGS